MAITRLCLLQKLIVSAVLICFSLEGLSQNTLDKLGLTSFSPSVAAFSIRQLSNAYSGPLLNVRRSSDNAQQDIGFDAGGNLDQAALLAFVGAGNGFVTIWYDQSGNGYNAVQATAANQPRIVNAGVVEIKNGKPAIFLNGNTG